MRERLQIILQEYNLNPSRLADKLGVQRSGISHIMSGRNKPGYDFLTGLLDIFPDIDANWLLTGKGDMYKTGSDVNRRSSDIESDNASYELFNKVVENQTISDNNLTTEEASDEDQNHEVYKSKQADFAFGQVEAVVLLMKNGKFRSYHSE